MALIVTYYSQIGIFV